MTRIELLRRGDLHNKEAVADFLREVVTYIHGHGFFLSGSITIDDKRTCKHCGHQMELIREGDTLEAKCPACMETILEAYHKAEGNGDLSELPSGPKLPIVDPTAAVNNKMDSKICAICGGLAYRTGTCYTCRTCGSNEGCS